MDIILATKKGKNLFSAPAEVEAENKKEEVETKKEEEAFVKKVSAAKKESEELEILIKYHNPALQKIEKITVGDWIDLRAAESIPFLDAGVFCLISLGVSMKLPEGYEAHLAPRSSTFKNFGIIQTNSVGVIDNSYSGDDDVWKMPVYALRPTSINFNERIAQFRIVKKQPNVKFTEVETLNGPNRGGFGSTGKN